MPVVISTDEETDRLISVRQSQKAPMRKDVAFGLTDHIDRFSLFEVYGLQDHPFLARFQDVSLNRFLSAGMSSALHSDKVAHYIASIPGHISGLVDLRKIVTGNVIDKSAANIHEKGSVNPLDNERPSESGRSTDSNEGANLNETTREPFAKQGSAESNLYSKQVFPIQEIPSLSDDSAIEVDDVQNPLENENEATQLDGGDAL
jgi:hypothetical protein